MLQAVDALVQPTEGLSSYLTLSYLTLPDLILLQAVDALVQPTEGVDPKQMAMLAEAIEEVQPMVGQAEAEDDELDDEI